MMNYFDLTFDAQETASHLIKLVLAYLLALPIGWNREREERSAGIRTFPLVAMAACGFAIIAIGVLGKDSPEQAKVLEGLITGVGFIGGGAILKQGAQARGTATAASLWATGALGAAVGYGLVDIAVILSVVTYVALRILSPLKEATRDMSVPQGAGRDAELGAEGAGQAGS
ncbi:magnesium transporter MgtC [Cypionkella aquatica]|uniref:Protein MgtC n=1 Tax=Cypionkella aquatica TaxID=1756042 RepID=A0AA37TTA0_9RHOB|nr:MgtC/SapB family protein [Cypionkella aquatica]GLS85448.1 magnesium transporter MgtC [Cypionkella aquatica]